MTDWGVRPEQVVDFQSLVGDSVDNVPGVPGVGPKTAAKWLQEFGTLDNIVKNADAIGGAKKSKVKDALKDAIANGNLEKSRSLVRLDTKVPLNIDWEGWRRRDWDGQRLLELCQEFGFRGFAERVRNTLKGSGASRKAAMLETAGMKPDERRGSSPPTAAVAKSAAKPKKPASINLFSALGLETEETPPTESPPAAEPPADNWSYAGYKLIDTP